MKAAVFENIETMVVRDVPIPACEDDGILVRVEACGICGSDIRNFHGGLRHGVKSQIMGHEIAGTVEAAGKHVRRFKVGDHVAIAPDVSCGECWYCRRGLVNLCLDHKMLGTDWPGGFAQYVYGPGVVLARGMVHRMPDGLGFEEATLSEPAASVIACQEYNRVEAGETVAVIGDGPIGCLHVEVARARGASTIIMIGLTRLKLVPAFGPDAVIDAGAQDPVEQVRKLTGGLGADIAICANPVAKTQAQAVELVRKRGRVVLFGGVSKQNPMTTLNSNTIHYNEISVVGAFSYTGPGHEKALRFIHEGKISARKYISGTVPLGRIAEGIALAEKGEALKVLVTPWAE
ncbi:MAG: alcohol dehydrogenase catalytic domain-containing protein [Kiritimatiellae bacterium]|nr:alcohol dehydrogenase catalytic domain-containing protein [Kiritimatiellia bacterium]